MQVSTSKPLILREQGSRSGSEIKAGPGKEARAPRQRPGRSPFPYLALGSDHQGHAGEEEEPAAALAATARHPP